jgi:phosphoribosylglycinamide formyltransferase-1
MKRRVAILISGRGSNMAALVRAAAASDFPAEIAVVISNRADAAGLQWAADQNVPTLVIESKPFGKDRAGFEAKLQAALDARGIELICLAGFMRLLTPWFIGQWRGRMLNIHPALLPSYRGLHTHERALADGVKIHGCTVHFVVPEMDEGPIVAQSAVAVLDSDTPDSLAARVLEQEHLLYPRALRLVASGAVRVEGNRVLGASPSPQPALAVPSSG